MSNQLVSIVIPVYNAENYLERCLNSVLNQSYSNFEVILVDDGSCDNSGIICDRYADVDSRVKVIHKSNGGVSDARNMGMEAISGKWICFVDSDDYLSPNYLSSFPMNDDDDIYIEGYTIIKEGKKHEKIQLNRLSNLKLNQLYYNLELYNLINSPWAKMLKSSIVKDNHIKFDLNTAYGEDHIFLLNYMKHVKRPVYINETFYQYSVYDSSLSRNIKTNSLMNYIIQIKRLIIDISDKFACTESQKKFLVDNRTYDSCTRIIKSTFLRGDRLHPDDLIFLRAHLSYNYKLGYLTILVVFFVKYTPLALQNLLFSKIINKLN